MSAFLDHAPQAIGGGYKVAFRFANGRLEAIWEPAMPRMKGQMLRRYRRVRHAFLERLSAEIGGNVACAEVAI